MLEDEGAGNSTRGDPFSPEMKRFREEWRTLELPAAEAIEALEKPVDPKDLFVTKGNYERLMKHYAVDGHLKIHNNRTFPEADMRLLRRYNFDTCAIVGNSGSLLRSAFGKAIDSHSTVLRLNQAPRGEKGNSFARHVGTTTTFRLVNTRWANKYGTLGFLDNGLPLENQVTLVVTRAKPKAYDDMVQYLKKQRGDVHVLYLSSRVISAARRAIEEYRGRLERAGYRRILGGNTPSSGFAGAFLLLKACKQVTLYGFGLDAEDGQEQQYHYFHLFSPAHSKKKNSMNLTHSFDTERFLFRALADGNRVTFCGFVPGDRKHNRQCGMRKKSTKMDAADTFVEFDTVKVRDKSKLWKDKGGPASPAGGRRRRRKLR